MKPRTLILALLAFVAVAALGWAASVEDHRYDPLTTSLARQLRAQMVDQPAPPLSLADLDGRIRTLTEHRGRVVLINFWASWCEPCRREFPSMLELARSLKDRPFHIVAISQDEDEAAMRAFLKEQGYDPPTSRSSATAMVRPPSAGAQSFSLRAIWSTARARPCSASRAPTSGQLTPSCSSSSASRVRPGS